MPSKDVQLRLKFYSYMRSIITRARQSNHAFSETDPVRISAGSYVKRTESQYDMHFGLELGMILSGVMRRHYQGHSRLVGCGQVWFCGMWEPHGFEVVKAPCEFIVLVIWPPLLAQQRFAEAPDLNWMAPFTVKPAHRPRIALSKQKFLLEQAAQLKRLIPPSTPVGKVMLRICLLNILALVLESCPRLESGTDNPGHEHWNQLNQAVQLVFASRSFVSTTRAAMACGLNRNIFSRLFAKWMGIRFADFALRYRLKLAADQLLSGDDPVKAVASHWGFVDASHFHRVFRKHYGCAPTEFHRHPAANALLPTP